MRADTEARPAEDDRVLRRFAGALRRRQWWLFGVGTALAVLAGSLVSPLAVIAVLSLAAVWIVASFTKCGPVTLLTAYLVLLFMIPARFIVGPLGAVGTPAALVALIALGWWASSRLSLTAPSAKGMQPIRIAIWLFLLAMAVTYGWAFRTALDPVQVRSADRSLIALFALGGVSLLAADGIESRERLDTLMLRLVGAGTFLASLGIIQFATGIDASEWFRIPGLRLNGTLAAISARTLRRVSGTALHGIEFGVVLTLILPIALHYGFYAPPEKRLRRWACVGIICVAIPMSISRSAIVGLVAMLIVLVPSWTWRRRANVMSVAVVGASAMRAVIPGLLGTLSSLVLNASSDPSVQGRTEDYQVVNLLFHQQPWLGLGLGTYLPQKFRYLDNQYLGQIVETGLVGLLALILLFVVAMSVARGPRRRTTDPATRSLGQSMAASIFVAVLTFGTFDALGFPINAGVFFLIVGCAGAYWRLERDAPTPPDPAFAGDARPVPA